MIEVRNYSKTFLGLDKDKRGKYSVVIKGIPVQMNEGTGWSGTFLGVSAPAKVNGVDVADITSVMGVE